MTAGFGQVTLDVWPPYVGLGESSDGVGLVEQSGHTDYQRGVILWETRKDGSIVGHGRVWVPKGIYTHIVFSAGPIYEQWMGVRKLEQPIVFDRAGFVDIGPIHNRELVPRGE